VVREEICLKGGCFMLFEKTLSVSYVTFVRDVLCGSQELLNTPILFRGWMS